MLNDVFLKYEYDFIKKGFIGASIHIEGPLKVCFNKGTVDSS